MCATGSPGMKLQRLTKGLLNDAPMHACPANANALDYVLKQRRWAGPDIEGARHRHRRYQRGAPIVGVRLSFTKEAKAIIWPPTRTVAEPVAQTLAICQPLERKAA
jgi:hypothetical protein